MNTRKGEYHDRRECNEGQTGEGRSVNVDREHARDVRNLLTRRNQAKHMFGSVEDGPQRANTGSLCVFVLLVDAAN